MTPVLTILAVCAAVMTFAAALVRAWVQHQELRHSAEAKPKSKSESKKLRTKRKRAAQVLAAIVLLTLGLGGGALAATIREASLPVVPSLDVGGPFFRARQTLDESNCPLGAVDGPGEVCEGDWTVGLESYEPNAGERVRHNPGVRLETTLVAPPHGTYRQSASAISESGDVLVETTHLTQCEDNSAAISGTMTNISDHVVKICAFNKDDTVPEDFAVYALCGEGGHHIRQVDVTHTGGTGGLWQLFDESATLEPGETKEFFVILGELPPDTRCLSVTFDTGCEHSTCELDEDLYFVDFEPGEHPSVIPIYRAPGR